MKPAPPVTKIRLPRNTGSTIEPVHAAAAALTALSITLTPTLGAPSQHWTLRCDPAGGTLPRVAQACARLGGLADPFAPVPRDSVCTDIYGGPQVARVVG